MTELKPATWFGTLPQKMQLNSVVGSVELLKLPPPVAAMLPTTVQLDAVNVAEPAAQRPPPSPSRAALPVNTLLMTVASTLPETARPAPRMNVLLPANIVPLTSACIGPPPRPSRNRPPPNPTAVELSSKTQSMTRGSASSDSAPGARRIPPASTSTVFVENVQRRNTRLPPTAFTPPPKANAALSSKRQSWMSAEASVACNPPPRSSPSVVPLAFPPRMVSPSSSVALPTDSSRSTW